MRGSGLAFPKLSCESSASTDGDRKQKIGKPRMTRQAGRTRSGPSAALVRAAVALFARREECGENMQLTSKPARRVKESFSFVVLQLFLLDKRFRISLLCVVAGQNVSRSHLTVSHLGSRSDAATLHIDPNDYEVASDISTSCA